MVHAAAVMAMLVDRVGQAPIQIQCVQQSAQEPWVKWLLPTIVQTVVSLASVGAGVGIAVWSFRKNRQSEQEQWERNQKAAHVQWVRDQKKAEWRQLLEALSDAQDVLPMAMLRDVKLPIEIITLDPEADRKARRAQQLLLNVLFIDRDALKTVMVEWVKVTEIAPSAISDQSGRYTVAYDVLIKSVRTAARKDLGIDL